MLEAIMAIAIIGKAIMNYLHLKQGTEPDKVYYIYNQPLVKDLNAQRMLLLFAHPSLASSTASSLKGRF
ncbi:MAG: hypothetical protein MJA27_16260 [Pseudanabaenales cyanobacterium]|nr:hypothetical protein [Pseudanabaenales cyanobacterium]